MLKKRRNSYFKGDNDQDDDERNGCPLDAIVKIRVVNTAFEHQNRDHHDQREEEALNERPQRVAVPHHQPFSFDLVEQTECQSKETTGIARGR